MDKIILFCKKRDDRADNLVKCLKILFPECLLELKDPEQKPVLKEKKQFFSEVFGH